MSVEFIEASLHGELARAGECLGVSVPVGWPDIPEVLRMRQEQLKAHPEHEKWLLRAMCERSRGVMVGHIGFHTPPGPAYLEEYGAGAIEFGFSVFEEHRRRGYAREAALALMNWAHTAHGIRRFVLCISPANQPSQRLARELGFTRMGRHVDEVDGEEDVLGLELVGRDDAGRELAPVGPLLAPRAK